jgi:hypothetical protein
VQSYRVLIADDSHQPDYDGVAELWFDDTDAFLRLESRRNGRPLARTNSTSSNPHKVAYFVSQKRVILDSAKGK